MSASKEVVIIGGGVSGLVTGYYLAKAGYKAVIIEKEGQLGGLSAVYQIENFFIEYYYHYFLSRDTYIVNLLAELKLESEIIWQKAKIGLLSFSGKEFLGYLSKQGISTRSSGWDFFSDRNISIKDKSLLFKLFWQISALKNISDLEDITAKDWIIKVSNQEIYEKLFEPILMAKWGKEGERISASWLVARFMARLDFKKWLRLNEYIGYPRHSFKKLFNVLEQEIIKAGGSIIKNAKVLEIKHDDSKITEIRYVIGGENKCLPCCCAVSSLPLPLLLELITLPKEFSERYSEIEHQKVICACLGLKKSLTKVLNVVSLPGVTSFNGLVEHTNIVPKKLYNNQTIVYLFKYLYEQKEEWDWSEEEIMNKWVQELAVIFPSFKRSDLLWARVSKDKYSDPVSVLRYSKIMPGIIGPINGLFLTGISRVPYIQDCNNLIRLIQEEIREIKNYLDRCL